MKFMIGAKIGELVQGMCHENEFMNLQKQLGVTDFNEPFEYR